MTVPLAVAPALAEMNDGDSAPSPRSVADQDHGGEKAGDEAPSADSDGTGAADGIVTIPPQDEGETVGRHDHCTTDPVPHLLRGNHKNCDGVKDEDEGDDASSPPTEDPEQTPGESATDSTEPTETAEPTEPTKPTEPTEPTGETSTKPEVKPEGDTSTGNVNGEDPNSPDPDTPEEPETEEVPDEPEPEPIKPETTDPQPAETERAEPVAQPETTPPTPDNIPADPTSAPAETPTVTSTSAEESSEAAGVVEEEQTPPSSPPEPTAKTANTEESGPVVRLFDAISENSDSTAGQMRQVILIVLGIGFLTAAGFVGATLHSRRGPR